MTRELKSALEVAQALEAGEIVERIYCGPGLLPREWQKVLPHSWSWNSEHWKYRAIPKPPERIEGFVNVYVGGSVGAIYPGDDQARKFALDSRDVLRIAQVREVLPTDIPQDVARELLKAAKVLASIRYESRAPAGGTKHYWLLDDDEFNFDDIEAAAAAVAKVPK